MEKKKKIYTWPPDKGGGKNPRPFSKGRKD